MNAVHRATAWLVSAAVASTPVAARSADDPAAAVAATAVSDASVARYRFRVPDDVVIYHGIVNFDAVGLGDGPILYAGGPIGLVAGVVVHALITDARRTRQKNEMQARADEVLGPYVDGLANFSQRDLFERSLAGIATPGAKGPEGTMADAPGGWTVEYAPVFAMNKDGRAIVLDNAVSIARGGDQPYRNTIRVVSAVQVGDDPEAFWAPDDLAKLKAESARLLALSFDIALAEARRAADGAAPAAPQRTLRYRLGAEERMERAELVGQTCERIVMRTLRGWVLSAPVARSPSLDDAGHPCATVAAGS